MAYWLIKSEPDVYSIDDLRLDKTVSWDNVRNYQARNYLKSMKVGDQALFYHSNSKPTGVVGTAKIIKIAKADPSQFDKTSEYFDPKATLDNPRWFSPEVSFISKFDNLVSIEAIRKVPNLNKMVLLQKGSRLSVQPVTSAEFNAIVKLGSKAARR